MEQPSENSQRPLLPAPPLIALIGPQQQPWQLMQLDIAYSVLPFPIRFVPPLKVIFILFFSFNSLKIISLVKRLV
jgi:hypothetical protein